MDNLNVHKHWAVKPLYPKLKITLVYNVVAFPDGNPIETIFSLVKRAFKKERLSQLANDKTFYMSAAIKRAFAKITPENVVNCARASLKILTEFNF